MKLAFPLCPGGRTVALEAATQADLFRELSAAVEVFGETHCGLCGEDAIIPIARQAGDYEFFEWACLNPNCRARLSLGVRNDKSGRLFPNRKLDARGKPDWKAGTPGDHRGWTTYHGDADADGPDTGNGGPRTPPPPPMPPPTPRAAAASAEPPAPPPPTVSGTLTVEEREAIGNALRVSGIGRQTFLRWCGYKDASLIPRSEYAQLLAAAKRPPADLAAMMAR